MLLTNSRPGVPEIDYGRTNGIVSQRGYRGRSHNTQNTGRHGTIPLSRNSPNRAAGAAAPHPEAPVETMTDV